MTANILTDILQHKKTELAENKKAHPLSNLKDVIAEQSAPRGFLRALQQQAERKAPAVIAEIKRASPSKGMLCESFDPLALAKTYMMSGASCLSILTDAKYFKGSGVVLDLVRKHCPLPVLRKDFMIDPYQIYESRAFGADCVLLIAAALKPQEMIELHELANAQGMDVLVEVHDEEELQQVLQLGDSVQMIGINNRNLNTFEVDIQTSIRLAKAVPPQKLLVSESGIASAADIQQLMASGIYVYLVGELLMTADDPGKTLQALLDVNA